MVTFLADVLEIRKSFIVPWPCWLLFPWAWTAVAPTGGELTVSFIWSIHRYYKTHLLLYLFVTRVFNIVRFVWKLTWLNTDPLVPWFRTAFVDDPLPINVDWPIGLLKLKKIERLLRIWTSIIFAMKTLMTLSAWLSSVVVWSTDFPFCYVFLKWQYFL